MEEDLHPHVTCEHYIDINPEWPPWSTRDPPSQFRVNFTFSCESHFTEWVESEDSPLPHLLSQNSQPETETSIVLNLHQFLNNPICREIMAWELRELPLTNAQCARLILTALKRARRAVLSMPSYHNVLNLHLRVDVVHRHTIRRGDSMMGRVMQESFDAEVAQKVPAADAAVEMVVRERVGLNDVEMCTICLDEVREAVRMPCSHVFHGDCIEQWLRIDHCCPLCRFEMPVAMETEYEGRII